MTTARKLGAGLLALAVLSPAAADPMRPLGGGQGVPEGISLAHLASPVAAGADPAAGPGRAAPSVPNPSDAPDADPDERRLTAIRIDPDGRRRALVGSHWLKPGDKVEDARIESIDINRVVLVEKHERRSLYLLPQFTPTTVPKRAPTPDRKPASAAQNS